MAGTDPKQGMLKEIIGIFNEGDPTRAIHPKEITEILLKRRSEHLHGRTPQQTVTSVFSVTAKTNPQIFESLYNGYYVLAEAFHLPKK